MAEFLTDAEVAARLGMRGTRWVADQARAGVFPHLRVGRSRRYTEEHFAEIVRICEVRPRTQRAPASPERGGVVSRLERRPPRRLRGA